VQTTTNAMLLKPQERSNKKLIGVEIVETEDAFIPTVEIPVSADTPGSCDAQIEIVVVGRI
jgi:hypothetical protein